MRVETDIRKSEELIQWLDSRIDGVDIPNTDRMRLAAGCLDVAMEHQKSIVLLNAKYLHGSAAALVRILFEAYVRGVWLLYSASDQEVELFKKDKLKKTFRELVKAVEKHEAFDGGTLSHVEDTSWSVMNSFTHTGLYQVVRRNTSDAIKPSYTDEEIQDAISTANSFGILCAIAIADMVDSEQVAREITDRGQEYFNSEP